MYGADSYTERGGHNANAESESDLCQLKPTQGPERIYLEPEVIQALNMFYARCIEQQ
jgi:hypothetical protein